MLFPLAVGNVCGADSEKMTYYDFIIRKTHKFLRNVCDPEVLTKTKSLEIFENFYIAFRKFVNVSVLPYNF